MSAPAPALAPIQTPVKVRMGDAANACGWLSVAFASLVLLLPRAFPHLIASSWQTGQLLPALSFFVVLMNGAFYMKVAHLQQAKPSLAAAAYLGALTVAVLVWSTFLLNFAVLHIQLQFVPNVEARVREEVLAHIYFAMVAAIFIPHLVVRFTGKLRK
jgi:hypothetical protein